MPAPVLAKYTPAALQPSTTADPDRALEVLTKACPGEQWIPVCVSIDQAMALELFSLIYGNPQWRAFNFGTEAKPHRMIVYEFFPLADAKEGLKGYLLFCVPEAAPEPKPQPKQTMAGLRRELRRKTAQALAITTTLLCLLFTLGCEPQRAERPTRNLEPAPQVSPTYYDTDLLPLNSPTPQPTNAYGDPEPDPLKEPWYPHSYYERNASGRPQQ